MDVFQQQGQLDYVAMSNSMLSSSLAISQRLAAAGISEITHQAGLAMSTRFRLGQMGQMRVSQALRSLRQYYGFERVLWFGFGHKSFLALLTEHQAGVNCAALCASLAEAYGVDQSAHLLQALWRVQGLSETLEPSRSQFQALVNGCSGLLLATPFPDVIRRMMDRCADEDGFIASTAVSSRSEDWAKAVDAIFQISKGNLRAIRVYGGRDIAFLGAIAHWLFDLRVWVESPDGTITFSSCRSSEQANVHLHYTDEGEGSSALLKLSATTFVLRSITDLIVDDREYQLTVRIPWKSCLSELFDDQLDKMLKNVLLFAKVLGAIARIYEALRKCEVDVGGLSRTHFINFQPAGHGRGFIDNICGLFPELGNSTFRATALEVLQSDVPACLGQLRDSIEELVESCGCHHCRNVGSGRSRCLVVVFMFIRTVANFVSHIDIKAPINPSKIGLQQIYYKCLYGWINMVSREGSGIFELASGLPHQQSITTSEFLVASNSFLLDSLVQGAATIFVGSGRHEFGDGPRHVDQPQCTARAKNGLCVWIGALQNLSADPASMAYIHIAPGQIVYKGWTYTSIWDPSHASERILSRMDPVEFGESATFALQKEPEQPHYALRILAQERAESGTIRLVYGLNDKTFERTLQPGIITEELLTATARVPCPQGPTCSNELTLPCWQRRSGWEFEGSIRALDSPHNSRSQSPKSSNSVGFIWNASSPISKLLAIEGCRNSVWRPNRTFDIMAILIRSDQCMSCMTRYIETFADKASWEHVHYYRKKIYGIYEKASSCALHII